ncbi:basic phospholipase A2 Cdr-13-like [Lagopus muta]|uniref:basic phospholipase A2 Cdr-13-like n=1 Tax=Lagopus muta TaxID=64668 RepID=UPI00209F54B5|nr:basic phospholipase A2 Cdr-13-like [Lagopus muta]
MNALLALAMLFASGSSPAAGSLWQLQQVVTKLTGKNAVLHYSFYGCYCGVGGHGQPKDATDRCCQLHDACYDGLQKYHCNAKQQHYQYSWRSGRLTCNRDSWCAQLSCECDRSLGLCLQRSARSYNRRYVLYLKSQCRR